MKKFWKISNAKQNKNHFSVSLQAHWTHCFHSFLFQSFYGYCFRFIGCNFIFFCFICFAWRKTVENEAQRTEEKEFFPIFRQKHRKSYNTHFKLKNCFNTQQLNVTTKILFNFYFFFFFLREVKVLKTLAHQAASTMLNWISRENDTRLPKPKRT